MRAGYPSMQRCRKGLNLDRINTNNNLDIPLSNRKHIL